MLLDLEALRQAPLTRDPFMFSVVPNFVRPDDARGVRDDFPAIDHPGLMPVGATTYGARFAALIKALQTREVAKAFSEKFDIDLVGRPLMITVRGRCAQKDGRIHTDTEAKLVTALIYFNEGWEAKGGRLRLTRGPSDLDDYIAEVPPEMGTLVTFRRSDKSFHGHEPFVGVRRYVMFNWMASGFAARSELLRHEVSAVAKRLFPITAAALAKQGGGYA